MRVVYLLECARLYRARGVCVVVNLYALGSCLYTRDDNLHERRLTLYLYARDFCLYADGNKLYERSRLTWYGCIFRLYSSDGKLYPRKAIFFAWFVV